MPCRRSVYQAPLGAEAHPLTLTPSDTHQKGQLLNLGPGEVVEKLWGAVHFLQDSRVSRVHSQPGEGQGQRWG